MSGEVPEGWQEAKLGDHCGIDIGGTPSRDKPQFWSSEGEGHPWVSIADLKTPLVNCTKEFISDLGVANSNVKHVRRGTVMMSFKLTIGRTAVAGRDLFTNEAIAAFSPRDGLDNSFLFYALPHAAGGAALVDDIGDALRNITPQRFERLILDLLIAMGYGGGDIENGQMTKTSGDGGIDGVINEDALRLGSGLIARTARWLRERWRRGRRSGIDRSGWRHDASLSGVRT